MDADDMIVPNTLHEILSSLEKHPAADLVLFGFQEINSTNNHTLHCGALLMGRTDEGLFSCSDGFLAEYMHCSVWAKLMRIEIIRNNCLEFDSTLKIGEDHHFALRYLQHCNSAVVVQEELYHYMHWNASAISSFEKALYNNEIYINAVTLYAKLADSMTQPWASAMLAHYMRLFFWVKTIFFKHKPEEWSNLRWPIIAHLPRLLWRAGALNSLRILRRFFLRRTKTSK